MCHRSGYHTLRREHGITDTLVCHSASDWIAAHVLDAFVKAWKRPRVVGTATGHLQSSHRVGRSHVTTVAPHGEMGRVFGWNECRGSRGEWEWPGGQLLVDMWKRGGVCDGGRDGERRRCVGRLRGYFSHGHHVIESTVVHFLIDICMCTHKYTNKMSCASR